MRCKPPQDCEPVQRVIPGEAVQIWALLLLRRSLTTTGEKIASLLIIHIVTYREPEHNNFMPSGATRHKRPFEFEEEQPPQKKCALSTAHPSRPKRRNADRPSLDEYPSKRRNVFLDVPSPSHVTSPCPPALSPITVEPVHSEEDNTKPTPLPTQEIVLYRPPPLPPVLEAARRLYDASAVSDSAAAVFLRAPMEQLPLPSWRGRQEEETTDAEEEKEQCSVPFAMELD